MYFIALFCSILHELGHITTAKLLGYKINELVIMPIGINGKIKEVIDNKSHVFIISISGPLVNLLIALLSCRCENQSICLSNIYMLLLNLLPIPPLDGWQVSSCFSDKKIYEKLSHLLAYTVIVLIILFDYLNRNKINYLLIWIMFFSLSNINFNNQSNLKFLIVSSKEEIYKLLKEKQSIFFIYDNDIFLGTLKYNEIFEEAFNGNYLKNTKEILEERIKNGYQRT